MENAYFAEHIKRGTKMGKSDEVDGIKKGDEVRVKHEEPLHPWAWGEVSWPDLGPWPESETWPDLGPWRLNL